MPDPDGGLRQAALRLLTRREHSRAELVRKLGAQAESAEQLEAVLDRLQAEHLLSDERYARQRVASRATRYGDQRLKQELRQQGVADEAIEKALDEGDSEVERCRKVWQKKFGELPKDTETLAKQTRFLQYRGFSSQAIRQTLRSDDA